jgi:hypothetical protein
MRAEGSLPALRRSRERLAVVDTFLTLVDRLHDQGRPEAGFEGNYCPSMRAEGSLPALRRSRERLAVVDTFLTLVDRWLLIGCASRPFALTREGAHLGGRAKWQRWSA